MIRDPEKSALLIAQLENEYTYIEDNFSLNHKAWERILQGSQDELDWAALGYTLHVLYTSMENYFLRISKFFENDLPREAWHKELLERMELEIPGIRPALLDRNTALLLHELRGFRHVFRTLYDERLDTERMELLQKKVPKIWKHFAESHKEFIAEITKLAAEAEEDGI